MDFAMKNTAMVEESNSVIDDRTSCHGHCGPL
jgi:hypothetical protein